MRLQIQPLRWSHEAANWQKAVEEAGASKRKVLTPEELACLLRVIRKDHPQWYPLILLLSLTGLRRRQHEREEGRHGQDQPPSGRSGGRSGCMDVESPQAVRPEGLKSLERATGLEPATSSLGS